MESECSNFNPHEEEMDEAEEDEEKAKENAGAMSTRILSLTVRKIVSEPETATN